MPIKRIADRRAYDRERHLAIKNGTHMVRRYIPRPNAHIESTSEVRRFRQESIKALRDAEAKRYDHAREILSNEKKHFITLSQRNSP